MDWIKAAKGVQMAIIQYSQLFLKFMAKGNVKTKDTMYAVNNHLMTNIK